MGGHGRGSLERRMARPHAGVGLWARAGPTPPESWRTATALLGWLVACACLDGSAERSCTSTIGRKNHPALRLSVKKSH